MTTLPTMHQGTKTIPPRKKRAVWIAQKRGDQCGCADLHKKRWRTQRIVNVQVMLWWKINVGMVQTPEHAINVGLPWRCSEEKLSHACGGTDSWRCLGRGNNLVVLYHAKMLEPAPSQESFRSIAGFPLVTWFLAANTHQPGPWLWAPTRVGHPWTAHRLFRNLISALVLGCLGPPIPTRLKFELPLDTAQNTN